MTRGERILREAGVTPTPAKQPTKKQRLPYTGKDLGIYDEGSGCYWWRSRRGDWVMLTESRFARIVRSHGFLRSEVCENGLTELENELMRLMVDNSVAWAGELAGWQEGIRELYGTRILITRGPTLPKPAKGGWKTLRTFLGSLLGDNVFHFHNWLKCSLQSLYAGYPWRPGPAFAVAGPAGSGKSLLQNLITEILGGRAAKPFRYLAGETSFNKDLFGAEHLMLEDDVSDLTKSSRRALSANLKTLIANETQSLHAKGRDALTLCPFWRITFTLNDEPDYLGVLPFVDDSIKDKLFLLRASRAPMPFREDDLKERRSFRQQLTKEVPGYLQWLRDYKITREWKDQRYGCKSWHDPELLGRLADLEEEFILLEKIDRYLWAFGVLDAWEGSANDLEGVLRVHADKNELARLLPYSTACGVQLARLSTKAPHRVERLRGKNNTSKWRVHHANAPRDLGNGSPGAFFGSTE